MRKLAALLLVAAPIFGCASSAQYARVDYPWGCTEDGRAHRSGCLTLGYRVFTTDLDAVEAVAATRLCPNGVQNLVQDPCKHETLVVCK